MPFLRQADNATNAGFRLRVKMAIVGAAIAINGEVQGAQTLSVWDARRDYALRVLNDPDHFVDRFANAVAVDAAIGDLADIASATDVAISNRVAAIWNDLAVRH
jgi:hypothetical protein